jgi:exonuclease VII large subunit
VSNVDLINLIKNTRGKKSLWYEDANGNVVAKRCTKCSEIRYLDSFGKCKSSIGGRKPDCRECYALKCSSYYSENKESVVRKQSQWRKSNPQKILEYNRSYVQRNHEKENRRKTEWRKNNKEIHYSYVRKWQENNKEKLAYYARKTYSKNKESILERQKKWRNDNQDKIREMYKRNFHNRQARIKNLPSNLNKEIYKKILLEFNTTCALTNGTEIHYDHVIPLSIGRGGTTFGNIIPLRSDLNMSKNNANIFEWFEANRKRFELSQERFDKLIDYLASANAMTVDEYRDYVYWCHANPRTLEELQKDSEVIECL